MIYQNYIIEEDNTGIAPANSRFSFYKDGDEKVRGFGKDVQECIEQINGTDTELETITNKDLSYWKANAEEDYLHTPISVLRYISELESKIITPLERIQRNIQRIDLLLLSLWVIAIFGIVYLFISFL